MNFRISVIALIYLIGFAALGENQPEQPECNSLFGNFESNPFFIRRHSQDGIELVDPSSNQLYVQGLMYPNGILYIDPNLEDFKGNRASFNETEAVAFILAHFGDRIRAIRILSLWTIENAHLSQLYKEFEATLNLLNPRFSLQSSERKQALASQAAFETHFGQMMDSLGYKYLVKYQFNEVSLVLHFAKSPDVRISTND